MSGSQHPGPKCQVRQWFADPVDQGTSALIATPGAAATGKDQKVNSHIGIWLPPLRFAPLGRAQGDFAEFEQLVLDTHILRSERKKGKAAAEIAKSELETVEDRFKLRSYAARACRELLKNARADLKAAKANGTVHKDTDFGLTSAYRGPEYDKALWRQYFRSKYYKLKLARVEAQFYVGEKNLNRIVQAFAQDLVEFIAKRKAAPGYSNHTNGIAVDFWTKENGVMHQAESGKGDSGLGKVNAAWATTWLYKWLERHKSVYQLDRIETEAWHWEFKKSAPER